MLRKEDRKWDEARGREEMEKVSEKIKEELGGRLQVRVGRNEDVDEGV